MEYQLTRELAVIVERSSVLWVPEGSAGVARAGPDAFDRVLAALRDGPFGQPSTDLGLVTRNGSRLFDAGGRIWHETCPTEVPTLAALYDSTARRLRQELSMLLDDDGLHILIDPRSVPTGLVATPYETYTIPATEERGGQFSPGSPFWERLALPFVAVRRRTVATLAYRPGSHRAEEYPVERTVDHVTAVMCTGCSHPCRSVFAARHVDGASAVTINAGDDYSFGHLWSTTLAQTALFLLAAQAGVLDEVDLALADPLNGFRALSLLPDTHPVGLLRGGFTTAREIQGTLWERMLDFLDMPHPDEAVRIVARDLAATGRWITSDRR